MTWTPRSIRNTPDAQDAWEGPYSGVPLWLSPHLERWVRDVFYEGQYGGIEHYWEPGLQQIQLDLHLIVDWSRAGRSAIQSLIGYRMSDPEIFLDIVDWCIAHTDAPELPGDLQSLLDHSGSLYTITTTGGRRTITERVDATVIQAVHSAATPESRSSKYLALAWNNVYGRVKDPSSGYRNAIRAVEAAAKPVISPANDLTTLGTIINDLSVKPEKWRVVITPESGVDPIDVVVGQMKLIWKGQLDRHGTNDETIPIEVSIQEAQAAVHVAALLVHLFESGAIARI